MKLRKQYKMMFESSTAMENFNNKLDKIKDITGENRGPLMVKAVNHYYEYLQRSKYGKRN